MSHKIKLQLAPIGKQPLKKCVPFWRRIVCLACALICVLGLSVQSFALVQEVNYSDVPSHAKMLIQPVSEDSGIYSLDVHFEGSAYDTADSREAWKMVMGEWLNDPDYQVIFTFSYSYFWVYAAPKDSISSTSTNLTSSTGYMFSFYTGASSAQIGQLYQFKTGSWSTVVSSSSGQVSQYYFDNGVRSLLESIPSRTYGIVKDMTTLIINDDVRDNEPDPPPTSSSEPEEPSAPSIIPPVDPVIPEGNPEYVVYPTSIWLSFFRWVRWHIGNGVFTGFSLLAAIIGIYLILRIVKHYSRQ